MAEELGRQIALQASRLAEEEARRVERRVGWAWNRDGGRGMSFRCQMDSPFSLTSGCPRDYNLNQLFADGWIIERTFETHDHSGEKNFTHLVIIRKKPAED